MSLISSPSNPKIKQARQLRQRKYRQESGLILVEGIHPVGEAVAAAAPVEAIYYAPDLLSSEFAQRLVEEQIRSGINCYAVAPQVFETITEKDNPQGILAVVRPRTYMLEDLDPKNFPWGVALVAPQDPGNIGAILRTIDAVGASGLILLDSSADPYHPSAVRASMGTIFWYPLAQTSFTAFIDWAQRHAYHLIGASAHGERDYRLSQPYARPAILLLGSEQKGLQPEHLAICEKVLSLPMHGRASSLNLAVAAGVLLYQMLDNFKD
jgi:TrmH family RNA methyltransferase